MSTWSAPISIRCLRVVRSPRLHRRAYEREYAQLCAVWTGRLGRRLGWSPTQIARALPGSRHQVIRRLRGLPLVSRPSARAQAFQELLAGRVPPQSAQSAREAALAYVLDRFHDLIFCYAAEDRILPGAALRRLRLELPQELTPTITLIEEELRPRAVSRAA